MEDMDLMEELDPMISEAVTDQTILRLLMVVAIGLLAMEASMGLAMAILPIHMLGILLF